MKSIVMLKYLGWILMMFPGSGAFGQVIACNQGAPNGYGMICVDPWSPMATDPAGVEVKLRSWKPNRPEGAPDEQDVA